MPTLTYPTNCDIMDSKGASRSSFRSLCVSQHTSLKGPMPFGWEGLMDVRAVITMCTRLMSYTHRSAHRWIGYSFVFVSRESNYCGCCLFSSRSFIARLEQPALHTTNSAAVNGCSLVLEDRRRESACRTICVPHVEPETQTARSVVCVGCSVHQLIWLEHRSGALLY